MEDTLVRANTGGGLERDGVGVPAAAGSSLPRRSRRSPVSSPAHGAGFGYKEKFPPWRGRALRGAAEAPMLSKQPGCAVGHGQPAALGSSYTLCSDLPGRQAGTRLSSALAREYLLCALRPLTSTWPLPGFWAPQPAACAPSCCCLAASSPVPSLRAARSGVQRATSFLRLPTVFPGTLARVAGKLSNQFSLVPMHLAPDSTN